MSLAVFLPHLKMRISVGLLCFIPTSNIMTKSIKWWLMEVVVWTLFITKSAENEFESWTSSTTIQHHLVDKTSQFVSQHCLMPIHFLRDHVRIWCDALAMSATYILLGRTWLYDLDVTSFGKSNTYTLVYNRKNMVLTLAKTIHISFSGMVSTRASKKPLHMLNKQ